MKKGLLITFEGPEGGGKSTQIKLLELFFKKQGKKPVILREPGGTGISEKIRQLLLDPDNGKMGQSTELLLYLAARAQLVHELIGKAIPAGKIVICDRYEDSTLAYQGYGRGFDVRAIQKISEQFVRKNLLPDLTIVLDIDPVKGMKRGGRHDRMEKQSLEFHQKVRKGFLSLAKKNPKRYLVLDATLSKETIAEAIQKRVKHVL